MQGRLNISYANGVSQSFKLMGFLLRPKIFI